MDRRPATRERAGGRRPVTRRQSPCGSGRPCDGIVVGVPSHALRNCAWRAV